MDAKTNAVTGAGIKHAIETRDGRALTNFYADDAVLQIVDRNNPPSQPREVKGKTAIGTFWDDICSRAMTHQVESSVIDGNQLAFRQALEGAGVEFIDANGGGPGVRLRGR